MSEPNITTRNEFHQRYWLYYTILEDDFLTTERFIAIDKLNFDSFSNEYIKQYQTICSEIDVIAKSYCKELDFSFRGRSIPTYCKCIIDNSADFANHTINVKNKGLQIKPWENWSYTVESQEGSKGKITSQNPDWWQKYNKIKHDRTSVNNESGLPYYKSANQKNVLNALAGLFQLELHYYRLLQRKYFPCEPDMPGPDSKLYEIANWGNKWVMAGEYIGFQIAEV